MVACQAPGISRGLRCTNPGTWRERPRCSLCDTCYLTGMPILSTEIFCCPTDGAGGADAKTPAKALHSKQYEHASSPWRVYQPRTHQLKTRFMMPVAADAPDTKFVIVTAADQPTARATGWPFDTLQPVDHRYLFDASIGDGTAPVKIAWLRWKSKWTIATGVEGLKRSEKAAWTFDGVATTDATTNAPLTGDDQAYAAWMGSHLPTGDMRKRPAAAMLGRDDDNVGPIPETANLGMVDDASEQQAAITSSAKRARPKRDSSASPSSSPQRRCGECEGCTRELCGNCDQCRNMRRCVPRRACPAPNGCEQMKSAASLTGLSPPSSAGRFGGPGSMRQTCRFRKCIAPIAGSPVRSTNAVSVATPGDSPPWTPLPLATVVVAPAPPRLVSDVVSIRSGFVFASTAAQSRASASFVASPPLPPRLQADVQHWQGDVTQGDEDAHVSGEGGWVDGIAGGFVLDGWSGSLHASLGLTLLGSTEPGGETHESGVFAGLELTTPRAPSVMLPDGEGLPDHILRSLTGPTRPFYRPPAPAQQAPMPAVQPHVLEAVTLSGFSQPCSRLSECPPLHVVVPRTAGSFDASAALAALVMKL